jgi:delta-aminolevulinic acid dehydratase/porphobilinogen synthase
MLWHASEKHVVDLKAGVLESLESAIRAGASILITYYTPWVLGNLLYFPTNYAEWMKEEKI